MDIKELSVGDWVMYRNREWQVCSLYQFTGEVGLWRKDSQICENVADLTPIPLTPEILEKNGFKFDFGTWFYMNSNFELSIYRGEWYQTVAGDEYRLYPIKYVHQLQHALRLAGIEKEIEL